jgi:hypothetical protein
MSAQELTMMMMTPLVRLKRLGFQQWKLAAMIAQTTLVSMTNAQR